jgi:LPXTG-motif cell wall-anchored protein
MSSEYASNTKGFLIHDDVTWRESMDGSSFLLGAGLLASLAAVLVWWRRRS